MKFGMPGEPYAAELNRIGGCGTSWRSMVMVVAGLFLSVIAVYPASPAQGYPLVLEQGIRKGVLSGLGYNVYGGDGMGDIAGLKYKWGLLWTWDK